MTLAHVKEDGWPGGRYTATATVGATGAWRQRVLLVLACCVAAAAAASGAPPARLRLRLRGGGGGGSGAGARAAMAGGGGGVLYLIGLGLGDEKDITVKGLETVKRCKAVFLEAYTSILGVEKERVEAFYGREIALMDREAVEQECDTMLEMAKTEEVAFLVVGDVYGATTHTDIAVRAREMGVAIKVIHNASIMNACGAQAPPTPPPSNPPKLALAPAPARCAGQRRSAGVCVRVQRDLDRQQQKKPS